MFCACWVVVTRGGTVAEVTLNTARRLRSAGRIAGLADRHGEDAVDRLGGEIVLGGVAGEVGWRS